jgi:dipeptidyl aminopeptidase/acylaminoacyl peptidase
MKCKFLIVPLMIFGQATIAQTALTPASLWQLGRLNPVGLTKDGANVQYSVSTPNVSEGKSSMQYYNQSLIGGKPQTYKPDNQWQDYDNAKISPDGKYIAFSKEVPLEAIFSTDKYKDLPKSNAYIFTDLNNRHWDAWEDGKYSHIFIGEIKAGKVINETDIMAAEKYDAPQKPFGGAEDIVWSPDSKEVLYVCKKKYGKDYALSTNTDIFKYDIATKQTSNITAGMVGYDQAPAFSPDGKSLAWLSMQRDGFESDKQDIVVMDWLTNNKTTITSNWDETVNSFVWGKEGNNIFFEAPKKGTVQIFEYTVPQPTKGRIKKTQQRVAVSPIRQLTNGDYDVNGVVGQSGNTLVVTRSDMNHANELYTLNRLTGDMQQLTHVNDEQYAKIKMCNVESRTTTATDGSELFSWVVYPPDFDANKKYPVLLYCQGGPQGAISQFYSFRWNFALMASQGYIVVVPNRRGCQGWGTQWNEAISKDWGGQAIDDYLAAFDDFAKEKYVDKNRAGAVGASYGGYSVFMLAGKHNNRFKSFIAHDGLFDLRSWYGTTEELWFANFDIGGPYWNGGNKSYDQFNPINFVDKWNTPIMIVQGGKDYRVGIEQGLEAFQVAQLKGIKSKLLYLPEENHWVLKSQNAQVWQREFFSWLKETL